METYSFTIPSLQDDTPLDCRIYHPANLQQAEDNTNHELKGVIIAHPYAPLGGSQDDHVVIALTECLVKTGHTVATFNFRGAGESAGTTSWTGHAEIQDYISVVGLLVYYLHHLNLSDSKKEPDVLSPVLPNHQPGFNQDMPFEGTSASSKSINLLLAGYSFGSLILTRLPSITTIIQTFETAERGTSGAEIFLRARALARRTLQESRPPSTPKTRKHAASNARSSPITIIGGEETDSSERRRSKDSHRRSISAVRELPHRVKTHIRRHSGSSSFHHHQRSVSGDHHQNSNVIQGAPRVNVRYFLVSPVLFPLSTVLLPPGLALPKTHGTDASAGVLSLKHPTLVAFGDSDHFTSAKKLRQWAGKLASESAGLWKWIQVNGAGHFWREEGVAERLEGRLVEWIKESDS